MHFKYDLTRYPAHAQLTFMFSYLTMSALRGEGALLLHEKCVIYCNITKTVERSTRCSF